MRLVGRIWIVLACVLFLVACGSDDSSDTPGPASTPVATPPVVVQEMQVGEIIWAQSVSSEDGEPTEIVTRFHTQSPAIIAVLEVSDIPEGISFTATWTINDQPIDGIEMDISTTEDLDHAWIAFSFTRDENQRYPIGQLNVVITTSEGHLREGSVEIGFP